MTRDFPDNANSRNRNTETTGVEAFERGGRMDNFSAALQHLREAHDKEVEGKN